MGIEEQEETQFSLQEYKTIETHLYGEIMKNCRSYSGRLNIISILGVLDLVKQEIKDLEKTNRKFSEHTPEQTEEFVTDRIS